MKQVVVGRGDDSHICLLHLCGSHLDELSALEHPQELGLGGEGQLADLVQEQGPAISFLEIAFTSLYGSCERAFLVPEQL